MALVPPAQTESGALHARDYLDALHTRLDAYALLTGVGHGTGAFLRTLCAGHARGMPAPGDWRRHSALAPDGAPVEFSETVGAAPVAITVDPGPFGSPPAARLATAVALLQPHWPLADRFATALFGTPGEFGNFTLWLGGDAENLRIYAQLGGRQAGQAAVARAHAGLHAAGFALGPEVRQLWARAGGTQPRMLSLTIRAGQAIGAKLYLRAERCPLAEAFAPYLRRMLGVTGTWEDPNTGVGIALAPDGALLGYGIHHYAAPYFGDDEALRRRLISAGPALGLDIDPWRGASRVMTAPPGQRWRGMLGYALLADSKRPRMKIYVRTGALLPRDLADLTGPGRPSQSASVPILDGRATC